SGQIRHETLAVVRDQVAANAAFLALDLEKQIARRRAQRQRELDVVHLCRVVKGLRGRDPGGQHRRQREEQDKERELHAPLDRMRARKGGEAFPRDGAVRLGGCRVHWPIPQPVTIFRFVTGRSSAPFWSAWRVVRTGFQYPTPPISTVIPISCHAA